MPSTSFLPLMILLFLPFYTILEQDISDVSSLEAQQLQGLEFFSDSCMLSPK
jgi:hypothetical protein